jgi:hypothetical protein
MIKWLDHPLLLGEVFSEVRAKTPKIPFFYDIVKNNPSLSTHNFINNGANS